MASLAFKTLVGLRPVPRRCFYEATWRLGCSWLQDWLWRKSVASPDMSCGKVMGQRTGTQIWVWRPSIRIEAWMQLPEAFFLSILRWHFKDGFEMNRSPWVSDMSSMWHQGHQGTPSFTTIDRLTEAFWPSGCHWHLYLLAGDLPWCMPLAATGILPFLFMEILTKTSVADTNFVVRSLVA